MEVLFWSFYKKDMVKKKKKQKALVSESDLTLNTY